MALEVSAPAQINGTTTPSPAEDAELYDQLLRLRDAVIAGKHATVKLPASAIAQLKASLIVPDSQAHGVVQSQPSAAINGPAFTTNQAQPDQSSSFPTFTGLPGLQASSNPLLNGSAHVYGANSTPAAGLDPIFLEKSDSLVRAEGQLKRQRLERDLQSQVDQRKHASRDKDPGADAPSPIDIDLVLITALERVKPISGLKATAKSAASSSFDENDYYSSQVQSDWSSDASSSKGSDKATGAFTADFERLDGAPQASGSHAQRSTLLKGPAAARSSFPQPFKGPPHSYENDLEDVYEPEDEDDEYTPPDATAFDSSRDYGATMDVQQITPPEDDNSEYEPGEITQDSNIPTPHHHPQQPTQPSPHVPVIRNHLTHIAAPQPNRVSPLATAKRPSIELELVNGRPEVVQKPQQRSQFVHSRASTASPSANGVSGSGKKRRNKKRKRDHEPAGRSKRRRERQNAPESPAPLVIHEPYIKDEPVSPPPFGNVSEVPQYARPQVQYRPAEVDLVSPRHAPHLQYAAEPPRSGLRYEYAQPAPETVVRAASPATYRPVPRDSQDLRRVASLHYAQRPPSPVRAYSPVGPYRTVSMTYGEPRGPQPTSPTENNAVLKYKDQPAQDSLHYARAERSRSPPRQQEYRDPYAARISSPALMPPPNATTQKIVVDQFGNKYYAAGPAPAPEHAPRASLAPTERHAQPQFVHQRAPSRTCVAYPQYEQGSSRMAPPPPSRRQATPQQPVEYVNANGYRLREYEPRPAEPAHYTEAPTSPIYQQVRGGYEQMPPPPPPAGEPTSPVYVSRSHSVRPEEPQPAPSKYTRQASVAPLQYVRQEAPPPVRAVSVMPGIEYNMPGQPQRAYTQAPQNVRYVDQYGNAVFPREVRQVSEFRYQ